MGDAVNGTCLCGAVTVRLSDPVGWVGACHCRMCQRWSGSVWAGFPAGAATVQVAGPVRRYKSSANAERAFCETCGSHLWMRDLDAGAPFDLMPGLFDAAADWPLHSEIYYDRAMQSMRLTGAGKRATRAEYQAKYPPQDGSET